MTTVKKGRCFCGQTTFEYQGDELWCGYCHCESCRRNTSSPVTAFVGVSRDAYRFTGQIPSVYESSPGIRWHFCGHCGSSIAYDSEKLQDEIHFFISSLDDPESVTPNTHFHFDEHLSWVCIKDDIKKKSKRS